MKYRIIKIHCCIQCPFRAMRFIGDSLCTRNNMDIPDIAGDIPDWCEFDIVEE